MPRDAVAVEIPEDSEAEAFVAGRLLVWSEAVGQRKDRHGRWCGCIGNNLPCLSR